LVGIGAFRHGFPAFLPTAIDWPKAALPTSIRLVTVGSSDMFEQSQSRSSQSFLYVG
jgi:hypothetical protein